MNTTEWFPANIKPVRVGWYHTKTNDDVSASAFNWHWDGKYWRVAPFGEICIYQKRIWRGLKETA